MIEIICINCSKVFFRYPSEILPNTKFCTKVCKSSWRAWKNKQPLTQDSLKSLLEYNPNTGIFTWIASYNNKVSIGDVAESKRKGYIRISINNRLYSAHHLAWLYIYGRFPNKQLDHINNIRDDNRIKNLREVTNQQNCFNAKSRSNSHGYKGVYKRNNCPKNPYAATITINGKSKYLGCFKTPQEAHNAYIKAAKKIFGKFSNPG